MINSANSISVSQSKHTEKENVSHTRNMTTTPHEGSHVHALGSRPFDSGCKLILVGNKYKVGCLSVCVCAVVCCLVLSCHSK